VATADAEGIFAEGSRFGTYIIGPCIGHGGMARVYRAEHQGLQRQVALKILSDGVGPGTEGRARFVREARIAAAIKHPNVVNIFDIGVENRVPFLVMELLDGQDLEALLQSQGALSESSIIDIIIPVLAGLVAVHDAGIVHRDLKPGNIFLSRGVHEEVQPKLLDFGISKAAGADKLRVTSVQGLLMGTPLYMSPEALMGQDMTALSDQYSLGVVMYECATGINPFIADSVAETARRVTSGEFPPLSEHAIRPSRRLSSIIERAMSLDPQQRFPDMRALGQELLSLAGQRTRITWALTFGDVVSRPRPTQAVKAATAAHRLTRGEIGTGRGRWPLLTAAAFGVASWAALVTWSPYRAPNASSASMMAGVSPEGASSGAVSSGAVSSGAVSSGAVSSRAASSGAASSGAAGPEAVSPESVVRALTPRPVAARATSDADMAATGGTAPSIRPVAAQAGSPARQVPADALADASLRAHTDERVSEAAVGVSKPATDPALPPNEAARELSTPSARVLSPAPTPAPSPARVAPRPGVQELSPEWMIWPSIKPKARYHRGSHAGTNEAPIFD
jgi:hypothetical protein